MVRKKSFLITVLSVMAAFSILTVGLAPVRSQAASHREAPLIAQDPTADITDFFMFRSYEPGHEGNIVFILNVIPGEEPSSGPNYYFFDPNVLYQIHIDNNMDGVANDVRFSFQFTTEIRGIVRDAGLFLSYVALPPITALDGPGSEGLGLRQKYSVIGLDHKNRVLAADGLIAVPSNVGPKTMPDYASLAAQGVYTLTQGTRVFAGQREDPFNIDLGGIFDTLNLRRDPPLLTAQEDANDTANPFGVDMLSGFNVHTIALEVPAKLITADHASIEQTKYPVIGGYASTYRRRVNVLGKGPLEDVTSDDTIVNEDSNHSSGPKGPWVQIERLANPLINETIIGTVDKDRWNSKYPWQEALFQDYYLNPRLALALELVFGVPAAKTNRTDLVNLLLKYKPNDQTLSELLRLNLSVPPTPLAQQHRLGPLAHDASGNPTPDPAAWPNGRRPIDDVTDVAVRVVGGTNYINARAGDGVNTDDAQLQATFPFIPIPFDGRNRVHQNP